MKALESNGFVTPNDYSKYVRFNVIKGKYYRVKSVVFSLLLVGLAIALTVIGYVSEEKSLWIAAAAIVICASMFFYTINSNVKKACNNKAKVIRGKQHTIFGKNGFVFELLFDNEEENEREDVFYDELEAVYDTKDAIYLYIEKRSVIVIPKRNLNMTPAEARSFLEKYIPAQTLVICV